MATVVKMSSGPGKDGGDKNSGKDKKSGAQPAGNAALRVEVQPKHYLALGGIVLVLVLVIGLFSAVSRGGPRVDTDLTEKNISSPETKGMTPEQAAGLPEGRGAGVAGDAIPNPDPPEPGSSPAPGGGYGMSR